MPVTPTEFRVNFPAFANTATFPDSLVQLWLTEAYNSMDPNRWGSSLDLYAQLKAAFWIVLEAAANASVARGALPGQASGILSSKSAGPISAGYDVANAVATTGGADYWNQNTYGQRYWRKARLVGMGPIQAGVGPVVVVPLTPQY